MNEGIGFSDAFRIEENGRQNANSSLLRLRILNQTDYTRSFYLESKVNLRTKRHFQWERSAYWRIINFDNRHP